MMRTLVVDDEDLARSNLVAMLGNSIEVVGEASSGFEGIEKIIDLAPDAVFLDVEMPELSGFEMLAQLSRPPLVVFVTAYDHYAVQAFEEQAIDYLLKPLRRERVERAVARLLDRSRDRTSDSLRNVLERFPVVMKIAGRRGRKIVLIPPGEIIWIGVEDRLVFAHTPTERYLLSRTVGEFESILSPHGFFRVSRTDIVNLQHARELLPRSSGTWRLIMSNGHDLDVSRERAKALRALMGF